MSGSFDRPSGRPPYTAPQPGQPYDPYEEVLTGPPTGTARQSYDAGTTATARPAAVRREMHAPARASKIDSEPLPAPIVPARSVTGSSLTLVISIMCFLACLTAGTVYMIHRSAEGWLKDIASEVTVQVEPREKADTEQRMKDVVAFLAQQPGVVSARPMSLEDSLGLLEPWLGQSDALKSLPVPRLIAVDVEASADPNIDGIRTALASQFPGVSLDDHRQWQRQIRTVTRSFALGGLGILALVAAATTAIIVSATKSALVSNREIVEVLHFVGATDRFIAREFETHFLRLGIRAGLVGAISAMLVFLVMPTLVELLSAGTVTMAEVRRLVGTGSLDPPGYVLLFIVVVFIAGLCMLTSRVGVFRILNSQH